jgi:hypothetical protein
MAHATPILATQPSSMPCSHACPTPSVGDLQFAFARVKGDVALVQGLHFGVTTDCHADVIIITVSLRSPDFASLTAVEVRIWKHEFITIFRFSHCDTIHPADFHILEPIDESSTRYEEESGTVFLARELMEHLRKMTERKDTTQRRRSSQLTRWR